MKKIYFIILFLSVALLAHAQDSVMTDRLKQAANSVMMNIYDDIVERKQRFAELEAFGPLSLSVNQYGIKTIEYKSESIDRFGEKQLYAFGLTIVQSGDKNFSEHGREAFNFGFPLLGIKFTGYQVKLLQKMQFDIQELIGKHGEALWELQQEYMPIRLTMASSKQVFKTGEPIRFVVKLANVGKQNIKIDKLSEKTLFFQYKNLVWGAKEISSDQTKDAQKDFLRPGDYVSKEFAGEGFQFPEEFEIRGSYIMTFKEIKPTAKLKVKVVN